VGGRETGAVPSSTLRELSGRNARLAPADIFFGEKKTEEQKKKKAKGDQTGQTATNRVVNSASPFYAGDGGQKKKKTKRRNRKHAESRMKTPIGGALVPSHPVEDRRNSKF